MNDTDKSLHFTDPGEIDKLIHEPARLKIMAILSIIEECDFVFMMQQTQLTWGNLSAHIKKLVDAGYIDMQKEILENKPHTTLSLSDKGKNLFEEYKKQMSDFFSQLG